MSDAEPMWLEVEVEGLAPGSVSFSAFVATEQLDECSRAMVWGLGREPVVVDDVLYKKASIALRLDDRERWFHGVVVAAAVDTPRPDQELYRVELTIAPRLDLLRLGRDSRIYQEKSIKDVVSDVLERGGLPADAIAWDTTTTYEPHPNIVQYNESDLSFVSRLLFEEGIGFTFRNAPDQELLTLFDDDSVWIPIEGDAVLRDRSSVRFAPATITELREVRTAASDATMVRDYDFKKPSLDVSAKEATSASTGREVYLHPSGLPDPAVVGRHAKRLLERLRMPTRMMHGKSDCIALEPGRTCTVQGHPRAAMNADLRIVRVVHRATVRATDGVLDASGAVETYENELVAIPQDVPHRPRVAHPVPVPGGVQVAFVTVPPGEEIHVDEHARVKVRFPWDRSGITDDKSSTWMRVGQLALGGAMIFPRKDFEVIVDHELGDIDRPFVAGHLYNAEAPPPYALPAGKTRSSIQTATTGGGGGANEIRFEDAAGGEQIFMNASKDYTMSVDNETNTDVNANETYSIGSNHTLKVGADHAINITGARTHTVSGNQSVNCTAELSDNVGGSASVTISGARMVKAGGDYGEAVKTTLTRTVAALQSVTGIAGYQRKIEGSWTLDVSAAMALTAGKSLASAVTGTRNETVGALKMIKAKTVSVSCGAAYVMTAAVEKVSCGGSRTDDAGAAVAVSAGGGLKVKASNIVIEGKSRVALVAGAVRITLSGGQVKISAPTINLKGVKSLGSGMHKSN